MTLWPSPAIRRPTVLEQDVLFLCMKPFLSKAEACSSFQARRRARYTGRCSCRRHRDPVPPSTDPALAAPAGSVGISARRGRRDMAGRNARRSTDRPTRAGSLSAPQACLLRLRPSAANSRRHQRPGAPSAAARPALRSMFPPTPRSPSVAGDGISLTLRLGRKPINGVAGRLGPPAVRSCHMR